jgi:hypothetical protein
VTELRFDDAGNVDELPRFPQNHSFASIRRVAHYDDLPVFVVEDRHGGPYSNVYYPLFQLSQRCIAFAFHPRLERSRIVFRGNQTVAQYRTLVGTSTDGETNETLLTWTRRFSTLRPDGLIGGKELELRARRCFAEKIEDLLENWPSIPFAEADSGAPWNTLTKYEVDAFLCRETTATGVRLQLGLESIVRNRFPLPVSEGAHLLQVVDWQLVDNPNKDAHRWELISSASTRSVSIQITLRMLLDNSRETTREFKINTELPLPDHRGEIIVDGTPFQLCFRLDDGEPLEERTDEDWSELDSSQEPDILPSDGNAIIDPPDAAVLDLPPKDYSAQQPEEMASIFAQSRLFPSTCSLSILWAFLVKRRLAQLARCLWEAESPPTTEAEFLFATRRIRGRHRNFTLLALRHLRRHCRHIPTLEPVTTPVVRQDRDTPPAWACVETASRAPDMYWTPISSARLHPAGHLVIPTHERDEWRLGPSSSSAIVAQGRWNSSVEPSAMVAVFSVGVVLDCFTRKC